MHLPVSPPSIHELFDAVEATPETMARIFAHSGGPAPDGKYRHWDILRHLEPPAGLTHREWWLGIKMSRMSVVRYLPLLDKNGQPFRYGIPDVAHEMLHDIDKRATGALAAPDQVVNPGTRDTYLIRSLMEEAITSSQLEGAATTRRVAKEMLQTGRRPRNRNERMIANNYRAMHLVRSRTTVDLTPQFLLDLQKTLVDGTMRDEGAVGRLRTDADDVVVEDGAGSVLHVPPPAVELPERIDSLCRFANLRNGTPFLHPVIRAVLLHFWLAYDHPFVDGNGRTARALFYWSLARDGYWLLEFTSISRILRTAPARYARAFLYTETDDNDVTYFLLNQLRVIVRSIDDLYVYLRRKAEEMRDTRQILDRTGSVGRQLNHRQLALLHHALRNPGHSYTFRSHGQSHRVSYQTARTDLMKLAELGLLEGGKVGRAFVFDAPADLRERLSRMEDARGG